MRTLPKPDLDPKEVYLTCISRVKDSELKANFEAIADTVELDADSYEVHSQNRTWYLIDESDNVDDLVSQDEMEKVYTNRMVGKKSPGRKYYDEIRQSSPHNICPLCGHRPVEQLDHFLPKAKFPSIVVLPINLIPSCEKCNKTKLVDVPNTQEEQTLHPYYDDVTQYQWLFAEVHETSPASVCFFTREVQQFDDELNRRIQYHFIKLELNTLYASQTGAYISEIKYRLIDLYKKGGVDEVQSYLVEEEKSRKRNHINSWQRAMFQALAKSGWFCDGGFNA